MEGYGVAFAAMSYNKPCRIWKVVSDFAYPGGRDLIHKNKEKLSEMMAAFVHTQLELTNIFESETISS